MSANPPAYVGHISRFWTKAAPCRYQFRRPFQCHFAASLSERPCGTRSCWSFCPIFPAPGCRLRKCDFSKSRQNQVRGKEGNPAGRPAGLRTAAAPVGTPFFSCLPLHEVRLLNTHILFRRVWPLTKFPRRTCRSLVPSAPPSALLTGSSRRGLKAFGRGYGMMKGIDVSKWQGTVDFAQVKAAGYDPGKVKRECAALRLH